MDPHIEFEDEIRASSTIVLHALVCGMWRWRHVTRPQECSSILPISTSCTESQDDHAARSSLSIRKSVAKQRMEFDGFRLGTHSRVMQTKKVGPNFCRSRRQSHLSGRAHFTRMEPEKKPFLSNAVIRPSRVVLLLSGRKERSSVDTLERTHTSVTRVVAIYCSFAYVVQVLRFFSSHNP